jgi:dihydroneopterin aldolase
MAVMDCITLRGMHFHVLVGILPQERVQPQRLDVDVIAWVHPGRPGIVDYRELHDAARSAVMASPREYLEEIAEAVAGRALAVDGVARVQVSVRKPDVPLGSPLEFVEVSILRPLDG